MLNRTLRKEQVYKLKGSWRENQGSTWFNSGWHRRQMEKFSECCTGEQVVPGRQSWTFYWKQRTRIALFVLELPCRWQTLFVKVQIIIIFSFASHVFWLSHSLHFLQLLKMQTFSLAHRPQVGFDSRAIVCGPLCWANSLWLSWTSATAWGEPAWEWNHSKESLARKRTENTDSWWQGLSVWTHHIQRSNQEFLVMWTNKYCF